MRTRSGSDYQTSDCQTSTPEENPTTAAEVNRSATPDVNRSAMAMDALDAAITSLDIDGPATNESLAQMLRGLAQTLTKSFGNIIAKKDAGIRELKVRVTALEEKTDDLEQYSRRNTVRFRGIPETLNEDTDGLVKDVAARKLDVQLTKHDFVRSHRVGRKSEEKDAPRDVIVLFNSHNTKVAIMINARKLKGTHIFINEDLTKPDESAFYNRVGGQNSQAGEQGGRHLDARRHRVCEGRGKLYQIFHGRKTVEGFQRQTVKPQTPTNCASRAIQRASLMPRYN